MACSCTSLARHKRGLIYSHATTNRSIVLCFAQLWVTLAMSNLRGARVCVVCKQKCGSHSAPLQPQQPLGLAYLWMNFSKEKLHMQHWSWCTKQNEFRQGFSISKFLHLHSEAIRFEWSRWRPLSWLNLCIWLAKVVRSSPCRHGRFSQAETPAGRIRCACWGVCATVLRCLPCHSCSAREVWSLAWQAWRIGSRIRGPFYAGCICVCIAGLCDDFCCHWVDPWQVVGAAGAWCSANLWWWRGCATFSQSVACWESGNENVGYEWMRKVRILLKFLLSVSVCPGIA